MTDVTDASSAVMEELSRQAAAASVRPRPNVSDIPPTRYDAIKSGNAPDPRRYDPTVSGQFQPQIQREAVTATRMREALQALLVKAAAAAEHAAVIAAPLDGGAPSAGAPNRLPPIEGSKQPLFAQMARQVVSISQAVDLIEAQLKRMDEMLA